MKKRLALWLSILLLLGVLTMEAAAVGQPELSRIGSVSVSLSYQGEPVEGSALTLYRVGFVHVEGADLSFRLTEAFAPAGVSLDAPSDPETAAALAAFAESNGLEGVTMRSNEEGKLTFGELELGVYLLVQKSGTTGAPVLKPFLVTVPGHLDGEYVYDVDASPKLAPEPEETWPYEPTEPDMPPEPVVPELPQTGLVQWPVPVMLAAGTLLTVAGWLLIAAGRKRQNED